MGYAKDAMNELHGTDVFTEDERRSVNDGNVYKRDGNGGAKREMERRGQAIEDAMGRYRGTEPLIEAVKRLSTDYHNLAVRDRVLNEVGAELEKARATHAPMNGHHEGYAVILEELDELWEVCKMNTHKIASEGGITPLAKKMMLRKEALQVAAMAVRFIEDVCDKD